MINILIILAYCNVVTICGEDPDSITDFVDGDILIGYVDSVTARTRVQNMLAFQAAVTDTALWPKNATIGYVVHSRRANKETVNTVNTLTRILSTYPKLVAVVGFRARADAILATSFVSAIKLPCFTYSSGSQLDDYLKVRNTDYMTRITSTRSRQLTGTIPGMLKTLGVNIVTIIHGPGKEMEFCELVKTLEFGNHAVDVEFNLFVNTTDHESKAALKEYLSDKKKARSEKEHRIHTIVMLLYGSRYRSLIEEFVDLEDNPLSDVVIITDSGACKRLTDTVLEKLVKGNVFIFRLCQTDYRDQQVKDFIDGYELYKRSDSRNIQSNSKVLDSWYREDVGEPCIVEEAGDCKSIAKASIKYPSDFSRYNSRIYYTVRKIATSLQNITNEEVTEIANRNYKDIVLEGSSVGNIIQRGFLGNNVQLPEKTTFLRYSNGVMEDDYEVVFDSKDPRETTVWTSGIDNNAFLKFMEVAKSKIMNRTGGHFSCSHECSPGSMTVFDRKYLNCWSCVQCVGNTYTSNGSWTSCKECNSNITYLWANENRTTCDQPSSSVNLSTTSGKVLWVIVCINICILIFTVGIYIKYWKSRVIISSGRDLSSIMFVGILVGHIEAMFIAMEPSIKTCITIHILGHVFMMLTVCPLLVKTFRIWLVFKFSVKLGRKMKYYIATWITMSECAVLMLPHLLLLLIGLFMDDSYGFNFVTNYVEESLETPIVVTKSCGPKSFTLKLISIIYTGILLLASTVLGWDCRKLPDNYKESMYIFLSSLMSLLLVTVYVPAMLTMAGFTQVSLLAGVISIISVTLNLVIFIPKVYHVVSANYLSEPTAV